MNKNVLKWVLIAAVILGAAAFLVFSEMPSGKKSSRPKGKKEQIVTGHSKAFKIEPVEGITISAPKNALDKNREFKLTAVDDKQWKKDAKVVEERFGAEPFLVMDLDASMDPNELLPGKYTVQMDLKKMGVPTNLWHHVKAYRIAHGGKKGDCYEYNSRVNANGILSFESNQNSGVALAIVFGEVAWQSFGYTLFLLLGKAGHDAYVMSDVKSYFKDPKDVMVVPMEDPNGNFNVYFRWKDTSRGLDGRKAFEENEDKAMARLDELKIEAEQEYERRINKMATGKEHLAWWEKIANKSARDEAMKTLVLDSVLKEKIGVDSVLRKLNADPASRLPVEVDMNIKQIQKANDYLKNVAKVEPLTYSIAIYLMSNTTMGSTSGLNTTPYIGHCYIKVNMDSGMKQGKWMNTPAFSQSALLTLIHEGFHARQQSNYCHIAPMRMLPSEATAPVLEQDAARYLYQHGRVITVDPDSEEGSAIQFTSRDKHLIHAIPLDKISPKIDGMDPESGATVSYTLADLIEIVRETSGKKNVGMVRFCEEYARNRKFSVLIKKALGIDDATLEKGWEAFVKSKLGTIVSSQQTAEMQKNKDFKECWQINHTFSDSDPFMRIKVEKDKYYVKSWYFYFSNDTETKPTIFIKPVKGSQFNSQIHFYLKNDAFVDGQETPCVYMKDQPHLMAMDVANLDLSNKKEILEYDVVALFPPYIPAIKKVKNDIITFEMPDPAHDMKKAKLITGAVVTYKDDNGVVKTREVEPKYFGKKVKWTITGCSKKGNGFTLSAHWYYKPDKQTTYVSPESEIARWGAYDDEPEEVTKPAKEPKANYWKQVNAKMNITNSSFKEEYESVEEVYPDYRSIDLVVDKTEKSCDFSGMAATEETLPDGQIRYVRDLYMAGTLTYTEPPLFWIPGQQYKTRWEIADDPYEMKISQPFAFSMQNTSSSQAACTQSKKDKLDTGHSTTGKVEWLRGASTTFEAHSPEKDGPKFFTLTQTYSIKEREGSDLMATVTFEYDYEWVGEPEEEEKEEETAPEGGYWKLVKTEVDDSHASFKDERGTTSKVNGGTGSYSVHSEWWDDLLGDMKYELKGVCDCSIHFDKPKSIYRPNEFLGLKYTSDQVQLEGKRPPDFFFPHGIAIMYDMEEKVDGKRYSEYIKRQQPTSITTEGNQCAPDHYGRWLDGMKICEVVVGTHCWVITTYHYEWVEGKAEPKEKPISGGHWKLVRTNVGSEQGMISGSSEGISVHGGKGHYTAHVERDGIVSDREINFEKPKSVYRPGEQITLKVTNEKPTIKGGKEGMSYGDIAFLPSQDWEGCVKYDGDWKDLPDYNNKKVVGVAKGVAPDKYVEPGSEGFWIMEYIKIRGCISKVSTTYAYEWEE